MGPSGEKGQGADPGLWGPSIPPLTLKILHQQAGPHGLIPATFCPKLSTSGWLLPYQAHSRLDHPLP